MKSSFYIYPNLYSTTKKISNPYLKDLSNALENKGFDVVCSQYSAKLGILDLIVSNRKFNSVIFNWIEDLPARRYGTIQTYIFMLIIYYFKLKKINIVWTLHNKISHNKLKLKMKAKLFNFMLKHSDYIFTHSSSSFDFVKSKNNMFYYPHPFNVINYSSNTDIFEYDIIFWGNISPYKNIHSFLNYLHSKKISEKYKILIAGLCRDKSYLNKLLNLTSKTIEVRNGFLSEDELTKAIDKAKLVLFVYSDDSVLSSGALIRSISQYKLIIGPDVGNFIDFEEEGIIQTFDNYSNLIKLIDKMLASEKSINLYKSRIDYVLQKYTWNNYADFITSKLF